MVIFWLLVAGKTASTTSKALNRFLEEIDDKKSSPFELIKPLSEKQISLRLKKNGIGCYNIKAKGLWQLVRSGLDLRICSVSDLEGIHGIGPKTARCFVLHSRKDAECAGLHIVLLF